MRPWKKSWSERLLPDCDDGNQAMRKGCIQTGPFSRLSVAST
jgi:hypothetical protein